ncbi:MAG: adenosylcobinamide-GDP ribazoletransferase [Prevotella sp.]|nr:adenosylcobinamide-GDP ribazoletransferase [Prevotella sp.]
MQISLDTSKWYERIWAAFIFFTRLPFWRVYQPKKEAYKTVVEHWPLTGWLTGCSMAAIIWFGSMFFPYPIAIILAILTRLLITGALHEDGLADFFDGFGGGGSDRQRILDIMKDSHIGTYGVIALILYFLLLFFSLSSLTPFYAALTIIAADPYAKMLSAQLILMMPYARTEQTAKNHTVYRKFDVRAGISLAIQGLLPIGLYIYYLYDKIDWQILIFLPALVLYFLYLLIWRRLKGYTGDCCGAVFLLTELSFYLVVTYSLG